MSAAGWPTPAQLDDAADRFAMGSMDVIGYASTSTAYAIGFDEEAALVRRLWWPPR